MKEHQIQSYSLPTLPGIDKSIKLRSLLNNPYFSSEFSADMDASIIVKKIDSLKIVNDKRREELKKIQALPSHLCAGTLNRN